MIDYDVLDDDDDDDYDGDDADDQPLPSPLSRRRPQLCARVLATRRRICGRGV